MRDRPESILATLDECCRAFTFPMLDNGYVYLAATRMSLYRSDEDWGLVIEVFGFSPRGFTPDNHVHTFSSRLANRPTSDDYVSVEAHRTFLERNPRNDSRFLHPIGDEFQDPDDDELVASGARTVVVRGNAIAVPERAAFAAVGIELEDAERIQTFELCRFLAEVERDAVLATPEERRRCIPDELELILTLDAWNHPDVADDELPSESEAFRQLAEVLVTGDVSRYTPSLEPNTHWRFWPGGGTL